jgi:hypothetical protein
MQGLRRIFGRAPAVFPNGVLPVWQIEGLATFEESQITGQGRVPAGDFRAIVDLAAARGRFEPIDRVSGGITDWPGGHAPYAYGAYFHQFLADRYGPERLARLADATSGRLPFFGGGAFRRVFGRSQSDLWKEFRAGREAARTSVGTTDAQARRLTAHGFTVTAPRVAADGAVYYGVSNPHGFPALMRLERAGQPARVAWRAGGGQTAIGGGWVVFDQVERVRSVALQSDLYAVRAAGGGVRRLTREARAADPDLSPDGRQIVCTVQSRGRRALATLDFTPATITGPRPLVDDEGSDYEGPRWSRDGRQIVAVRRHGGAHEIVLVDPTTRAVRVLLSRRDARMVTPAWTPAGDAILFAAAAGGAPFNIFTADIATGTTRQITDTAGGAQYPELSPDGTLTYVGYTVDGSDLFSVPYHPNAGIGSSGSSGLQAGDPKQQQASAGDEEVSGLKAGAAYTPRYQPLRTLLPTFWTPIVESDAGETLVGAATAMADALGRHGYAVDAAWAGGRARPDWRAQYVYDRWRPTLFASYADDTDPIRGGTVRSREMFAGGLIRFRRLRRSDTLLAGFNAQTDTVTCDSPCRIIDPRRTLRSVRIGWLHDRRRQFGYSISAEEGFAVELAAETSRSALGSDANAGAAIVDVRGFQRVIGRHTVLAARLAAAASWGDETGRREFSAAGSGQATPSFDFGFDTIGLLRGVDPEDAIGSRAAVANLDLRVPLARPQRGAGTWPLFLHSLHAAAFLDAGHAWDRAFRAADVRTAIGAEIAADLVILHYVPLTIAGGAAWTRDPVADRRRAAVFGRIGYAF